VVVHPVEDTVRTVNGAESALHPGPGLLTVVRDLWVCVLQPSVHHKPSVGPQVRCQIRDRHSPEAKCASLFKGVAVKSEPANHDEGSSSGASSTAWRRGRKLNGRCGLSERLGDRLSGKIRRPRGRLLKGTLSNEQKMYIFRF